MYCRDAKQLVLLYILAFGASVWNRFEFYPTIRAIPVISRTTALISDIRAITTLLIFLDNPIANILFHRGIKETKKMPSACNVWCVGDRRYFSATIGRVVEYMCMTQFYVHRRLLEVCGYWHCWHNMQMQLGLCNGTVFVRLSVCLFQRLVCCCRPGGRRYRSITARPAPSSSTAVSSKCEQCHVISRSRRLNTDLSTRRDGRDEWNSAVCAMQTCLSGLSVRLSYFAYCNEWVHYFSFLLETDFFLFLEL